MVYTYTTVEITRAAGFADEVPFVIALVTLAEGIQVVGNIINCDPHRVHIGQPVRIAFVMVAEDWVIPMFEV